MQPLVHCVVIMVANEAGFFDCHFNEIPIVNSSLCNKACLVKDDDGTLEQVLKNSPNQIRRNCKPYSVLMRVS